MRSRYTAYVRGHIDYLLATHDPATRGTVDVAAATRWSRDTTWLGLEIVATEAGRAGDATGVVEFIARGVTAGRPFTQRERSRFRRVAPTAAPSGDAAPTVDGAWRYVDGDAGAPVRAAPAVGRNEACPCGSGKKFKRCHGA
jgi:SEC-C motif-containing protein